MRDVFSDRFHELGRQLLGFGVIEKCSKFKLINTKSGAFSFSLKVKIVILHEMVLFTDIFHFNISGVPTVN